MFNRKSVRPLQVIVALAGGFLLTELPVSARDVTVPIPPHPEIHRSDPLHVTSKEIWDEFQNDNGIKIRLDDHNYVRFQHDYLPVLLDWHHEIREHFGRINEGEGLPPRIHNERAAHVMRVMLEFAVRRDVGYGDAALMLGSVRIVLPSDWGSSVAGDRIDLVLVCTDQGYFLIDPPSRTMRVYDEAHQDATVWLHM